MSSISIHFTVIVACDVEFVTITPTVSSYLAEPSNQQFQIAPPTMYEECITDPGHYFKFQLSSDGISAESWSSYDEVTNEIDNDPTLMTEAELASYAGQTVQFYILVYDSINGVDSYERVDNSNTLDIIFPVGYNCMITSLDATTLPTMNVSVGSASAVTLAVP